MPDGGQIFAQAFAERIRPKPALTVSQWADRERHLPRKGSSEPGPWRTSRVPFARDIMDDLSVDAEAEEVIFVASTQVSKTEIGLNFIGYTVDYDPWPMLTVLPTIEVGERWSKQRLASMIEASPALKRKVATERSRNGSNTTMMKDFNDGILIVGGANSAASLGSMPIGKLFLDEIDRYPRDVGGGSEGGEGDPVDLAEARTTTFPRRKIFKCSSPTIMSLSRIWKDWLRSSQGEYHVPCPDCRELQVLKRENLRYDVDRPETTARFACVHCGVLISESSKTWMLDPANGARWIHALPDRRKVRGYHVSAWYTPMGLGKTWGAHAKRYEEVRRDPARLKTFINTVDGLCFKDADEKLDWEALKSRAEQWAMREIPAGCLVLTAGVDVQANRLAVQIVGWGRESTAWVIDWLEIPGDPTQSKVWQELDDYLQRPMTNRWGISMRVSAVAVDAGYLQDHVLKFTRPREQRNVIAVKGVDTHGKTVLSNATKPDKNRDGRTSKVSAGLWLVSSSAAKEWIFLRAQADAKRLPGERLIRFPGGRPDATGAIAAGLDEEYFTQFTAEVFDPHKRKWVKQQARNEALDTFVYALAAAHHPNVRAQVYRERDWLLLESVFQPPHGDLFHPLPPAVAAAAAAEPNNPPPAEPRPGGDASASPPAPAAGRRVRSSGIN